MVHEFCHCFWWLTDEVNAMDSGGTTIDTSGLDQKSDSDDRYQMVDLRWRVMPQQDGAFHLGRRLRERSRGKRKGNKSRAAKNIARRMPGKVMTVLLIRRMDIRYDQNPINSRCACRYCEPYRLS